MGELGTVRHPTRPDLVKPYLASNSSCCVTCDMLKSRHPITVLVELIPSNQQQDADTNQAVDMLWFLVLLLNTKYSALKTDALNNLYIAPEGNDGEILESLEGYP